MSLLEREEKEEATWYKLALSSVSFDSTSRVLVLPAFATVDVCLWGAVLRPRTSCPHAPKGGDNRFPPGSGWSFLLPAPTRSLFTLQGLSSGEPLAP